MFANVGTVSVISSQPAKQRSTSPALALSLAAGITLWMAGHAGAQVQEGRMSDLLNPDRTKTSDLAGKTFAASASVGGKTAYTRTYPFGRSAAFGGGDGTFRTRDFVDRGKFRTGEYATKADRASASSFAAADRGFGTKAMPVGDAPGANKSAAGVRKYVPGDKSIVIRGKRQDDLDDLYHQKNLSIDQVRELLNKPGSGTDAPVQKIGDTPVLRALPVNAPADR